MGPVINKAAMTSILGYIDHGKRKGGWWPAESAAEGDGYFMSRR